MKLHLGCGELHLEGYLNVDQPPASHTIQSGSAADAHADITAMHYPAGSIEEVRLHHVFEHFPRPVAAALAASWTSWLRPGGLLHIEVPDFARTARAVLSPFSSRSARLVGIRHLFGSHEAPWAVHCEGWTSDTLATVLAACGLEVEEVRRHKLHATYNFEMLARRKGAPLERDAIEGRIRSWFRQYLVDGSASEAKLLEVWMDAYRQQVARTWARPEGAGNVA